MASSADRAEYANEAERLRRLVQRLVERVLTERHNVAQAARAQIVELAMVIAERVVRRVAECDHSIAARAVAEALTHVQSRERVRVRLNPRDLQYVQTVDAQTAAGFAAIERLELVQDADVGVGGCVVETDMGSIDGRVETQLAQIEQALLAALRTGRVDEPQ
jgi:flagellar assembly protein FliH